MNTNRQFMVGNGILAFAVIVIVGIMVYVSMKADADKKRGQTFSEEAFVFAIDSSLSSESISMFLNDSLIFDGVVKDGGDTVTVGRFALDNTLMVVDRSSDIVVPYSLKEGVDFVAVSRGDDGDVRFDGR